MKVFPIVQVGCIKLSRLLKVMGLLDNALLNRAAIWTYFQYKRYFEDPYDALISKQPQLFEGGHILDVGANLGYTAVTFSRAIDNPYKVYAFEADAESFRQLQEVLIWHDCAELIKPIWSAVGETDGEIDVWHNTSHRSDHRIVTPAFKERLKDESKINRTSLISIDSFIEIEELQGQVAFVKIDVQGYELAVLRGMEKLLSENPLISVAFEYCPAALRELGFAPHEIFEFFTERNIPLYLLNRDSLTNAASRDEIEAEANTFGYTEVLASRRSYAANH